MKFEAAKKESTRIWTEKSQAQQWFLNQDKLWQSLKYTCPKCKPQPGVLIQNKLQPKSKNKFCAHSQDKLDVQPSINHTCQAILQCICNCLPYEVKLIISEKEV